MSEIMKTELAERIERLITEARKAPLPQSIRRWSIPIMK